MAYRPAYFASLTLRDVRCFGGVQTLDLRGKDGRPAKWTILLGENGVGKTTLLQCLDHLSPVEGLVKSTGVKGRSLEAIKGYLRMGSSLCVMQSKVVLDQMFSAPHVKPPTVVEFTIKSLETGVASTDNPDLLAKMHCCGYGAARRPGAAKLASAERSDPAASLHDESATLVDVEEWLLQLDYAAKSNPDLGGRFERVKQVLIDLLPDIDDVRIVGFDRDPPAPAVELHSPFGWIRPRQASFGYQAMMAWVVDLAARMFAAFPGSPDPLREASVVLIDEIDLHLHPRWQRDLIGYLDTHFPNVQFIATAHSPLVVQAALDANLVVLRREADRVVIENDPRAVQGWRIDQILTSELFGLPSARPPQVERLLEQRRAILGKPVITEEDRARLRQLDAELAELPYGETAEDADALATIRRYAAELRERRGTGS